MKIKNIFILVVFFSILMVMNLLVFAVDSEKQASNFQSNGDLIDGWYWLRDSALQNYAEWKFENISPGTEDLVLDITALATDRPNGGSGFEAKFKLIYGFPGSGNMGGVFKTKVVTLSNVSPPNDPLGYTCQGQVTVDREFISGASTIVFRVERELAQDNHVAFKKESIVLLTGETPPIEGGEQLPDTDELEEATLIQPDTYTGSLGEENEEGRRDNYDYYSIDLQEGQQITLQLTIPASASYGISLLTPTTYYNRGSVLIQGGIKTLDYVADSTGTWYIKINRNSGEGDYQLLVNTSGNDTEEQDNNPPVINSLNASQNSVEINQTVTILCSASDQDIETFTFRWSVNGEIIEEESSSLSWRAPDTAGTYNITCTVSDGRGGEDSESVSIEVTEAVLSCTYTLSGYEWHPPSSGGTGEFTVTPSSSACQWTAVSDVSWIQINSGGSGPGNKTLSFSVQNNTSEEERIGHITIENQDYTITQETELVLSLSDEGRALISNLPIFVSESEKGSEIDLDGDGILQEWEDKAMEYINPKFDLDEGEEWFDHPEHHVVNFVRVFPYTKDEAQYILFTYAVTWSKDYGRASFYGHNGDVESVIMAWEVITADGKVLELRSVFTSAHGGEENDHSAAWDAWNRDCFTRGIVAWPFDEEMCGQLTFEENILKLQVSEDKHAIYPTVSCCEDVTLVYLGGGFVMEDCGGGRGNPWSFDCYNTGEPNHHLIDDLDNPSSWEGLSENKRSALTNLFPQEQVWSGRKGHPNKFSGGLVYDEDCPVSIGNKISSVPSELEDKL